MKINHWGELGRREQKSEDAGMVKGSAVLFREAGVAKKLAEILVCPLSKQPLRACEETKSLISDALSVSYPIVDGIPCLVPKDGKLLDSDVEPDENKGADTTDLSAKASDTF